MTVGDPCYYLFTSSLDKYIYIYIYAAQTIFIHCQNGEKDQDESISTFDGEAMLSGLEKPIIIHFCSVLVHITLGRLHIIYFFKVFTECCHINFMSVIRALFLTDDKCNARQYKPL